MDIANCAILRLNLSDHWLLLVAACASRSLWTDWNHWMDMIVKFQIQVSCTMQLDVHSFISCTNSDQLNCETDSALAMVAKIDVTLFSTFELLMI